MDTSLLAGKYCLSDDAPAMFRKTNILGLAALYDYLKPDEEELGSNIDLSSAENLAKF